MFNIIFIKVCVQRSGAICALIVAWTDYLHVISSSGALSFEEVEPMHVVHERGWLRMLSVVDCVHHKATDIGLI